MSDAHAVLDVAGKQCTDLTRLDGGWVEVVTDPQGQQLLRRLGAGRLHAGARVLFRAALSPVDDEAHAPGTIEVRVDGVGRLGSLPHSHAASYVAVMQALARNGRVGRCSGYFVGGGGSFIEARLLLHEPDECLRRVELDVEDAQPASVPR